MKYFGNNTLLFLSNLWLGNIMNAEVTWSCIPCFIQLKAGYNMVVDSPAFFLVLVAGYMVLVVCVLVWKPIRDIIVHSSLLEK